MKNDEIKIGVLEFGLSNRQNSLSALDDIFTYATKADELGYSRFWISEHHRSNPLQPYNNPEILISLVAGMTENIRVGSAGSLIGYYSPYSLVQNYKLLNSIYNNRIDFGLSKGRPENSHLHNFFNLNNRSYENKMYLKNLEGICDLLSNEEKNYIEKNIVIPPFKGGNPALWYLSNSYKWKDLAIEKGLNICRSLMHGLDVMEYSEDISGLLEYIEKFQLKNNRPPETAVAIAISFSESNEQIKEKELRKTNRREALKIIAVSEDTFTETLIDLQNRYRINEFIIYDTEKRIEKKIENLNLIKELTTCKVF